MTSGHDSDVPSSGIGDRSTGHHQAPLARALTPTLLLVMVVGDVLGAGIYVVVGEVAAKQPPTVWLPFLLAFALAATTAASYSELVTKYPGASGSVLYVDRAIGRPVVTYAVGITVFAATVTAASTSARAFGGEYLGWFVDLPVPLVAVLVLVVLGAVNVRGIGVSARTNLAMTVIEVGGLLLVITLGALAIASGEGDSERLLGDGDLLGAPGPLFAATALAFFAFLGFEDAVHVSEEVRDPRRSYPVALLGGLAITGVIYLLVTVVVTALVDPAAPSQGNGPLLEVVESGPVRVPSEVLAAIALVAVSNTALLTLLTASRLLYGMAGEGRLPSGLARVHPTWRTPWPAILVSTLACIALAITGDVAGLAGTTVVLLLAVFVLVNVSVLRLRSERTERPHFRAPTPIPVVGAVGAGALLAYTLVAGDRAVILRVAALLAAGALLHVANKVSKRKGRGHGRGPAESS